MVDLSTTLQLVEIVSYCSMFLVGGVGNILVIIFFAFKSKNKELTSYHFIIAQLAVSDLIVCVGIPPVIFQFIIGTWYTGELMCKAISIPWAGVTASCWILCGLAYDRYRRIKDPMAENFSKKKITLVCLIVWSILFLVAIPQFTNTKYYPENQICYFDAFKSYSPEFAIVYYTFYFMANAVIPLTIFLIVYFKSRNILSSSVNMGGQTGEAITARNKKALKTLKMLIILYTVCVVPGSLWGLLYSLLGHFLPWFYEFTSTDAGMMVYFCYHFCICFNNVANFFIYMGRIPEFRKFLARPFQKCYRRRSNASTEPKPNVATTAL